MEKKEEHEKVRRSVCWCVVERLFSALNTQPNPHTVNRLGRKCPGILSVLPVWACFSSRSSRRQPEKAPLFLPQKSNFASAPSCTPFAARVQRAQKRTTHNEPSPVSSTQVGVYSVKEGSQN